MVSAEVAHTIRHKKAQYAHFADNHQWDRLDTVILADAKLNFYDENEEFVVTQDAEKTPYSFKSLAEFQAFFSKQLAPMQVIHVTGPGEMETTDREDEVKAVFSVVFHSATKGTQGGVHGTGGGHYYETWKRVGDDDWRIKDMWFKRIFWRVLVG